MAPAGAKVVGAADDPIHNPNAPECLALTRAKLLLWAVVTIQVISAGIFVTSLGFSVFGVQRSPTSWQMREALEIAASIGLVLGAILGLRSVLHAQRGQRQAEQALRSAAGAFSAVVDEKFAQWSLTKAECEVAWLVIKGFSTRESAELRGTSEGTIKSQCNAIYRKVGVTGRAQLLSLLVEDLLLDTAAPKAQTPAA